MGQVSENKCCIKGMTWQDKLQFGAMLLMAATVPVSWHVGVWAAVLLAVVSVVKLVADAVKGGRLFVNPALGGWQRAALWTVVAWVAFYAVSLLYSTDTASGLELMGRKAVMLIFPLCFLLTDTSYLKPAHIRVLFYVLVAVVCCVFLYDVGHAVGKMIDGATLKKVTSSRFDSRHHSYSSLYAVTALVFIYYELERRWSSMRHWHRGVLIAAVVCIILFVVLVNSRAGILSHYAMIAVCSLHFALRRRWWHGVLLLVAVAGFTIGAEYAIPGHVNRIVNTVEKGDKDARVGINKSSLELAKGNVLFGKGAGDYESSLHEQYAEDEQSFSDKAFNAHNQYMETLLATGIVGLLLMLGWLLLPLVCAVRHRCAVWQVACFVGLVMFSLLFESMLERQMGLLFIGFFMAVMVLITSTDENKFGRLQEK